MWPVCASPVGPSRRAAVPTPALTPGRSPDSCVAALTPGPSPDSCVAALTPAPSPDSYVAALTPGPSPDSYVAGEGRSGHAYAQLPLSRAVGRYDGCLPAGRMKIGVLAMAEGRPLVTDAPWSRAGYFQSRGGWGGPGPSPDSYVAALTPGPSPDSYVAGEGRSGHAYVRLPLSRAVGRGGRGVRAPPRSLVRREGAGPAHRAGRRRAC